MNWVLRGLYLISCKSVSCNLWIAHYGILFFFVKNFKQSIFQFGAHLLSFNRVLQWQTLSFQETLLDVLLWFFYELFILSLRNTRRFSKFTCPSTLSKVTRGMLNTCAFSHFLNDFVLLSFITSVFNPFFNTATFLRPVGKLFFEVKTGLRQRFLVRISNVWAKNSFDLQGWVVSPDASQEITHSLILIEHKIGVSLNFVFFSARF
jgi:hypothetical protein